MDQNFFLVSTEGFVEDEPRLCRFVRRVRYGVRSDLMLVSVTPSVKAKDVGADVGEISMVVLATRHQGHTLFPVSEWPSYVYCARIVGAGVRDDGTIEGSLEVFDWSALYPTKEEASRNKLEPFSVTQIMEDQALALEKARKHVTPEYFEELKARSVLFIAALRKEESENDQ